MAGPSGRTFVFLVTWSWKPRTGGVPVRGGPQGYRKVLSASSNEARLSVHNTCVSQFSTNDDILLICRPKLVFDPISF